MNNPPVMSQRFEPGQELTQHELREAFKRMFGRPIPPRADLRRIARGLAATEPLRFGFEVNRLRGYAWDNGDPPRRPE